MASSAKPPSTPMRRSCQYCRARKVRCSGQTICDMCRQRGKVCVYDAETLRGRRRCSISMARDFQDNFECEKPELSLQSPFQLWPKGSISMPIGQLPNQDCFPDCSGIIRSLPHIATIGGELERIFDQTMTTRLEGPTVATRSDHPRETSLLYYVAPDMLEILLLRLGHLTCWPEDQRASSYATSFAQDDTGTMFDLEVLILNPLTTLDSAWMIQLIDIWYSVHPLSILISKTLLLRSIQDGLHDQALLAIILSEAISTFSGHVVESSRSSLLEKSRALVTWSTAKVAALPVNASDISTARTLLLLGWHYLHHSQYRRAASYIELAAQIIKDLRRCLSAAPANSCRINVNGFNVVDIEHEVLHNIYWATFSLQLWVVMQMGYGPSQTHLLNDIATIYPPVDEFSSLVTKLDIASGNVSTIQSQAAMTRLLWPLSQLTATLGHVYALVHPYQETAMTQDEIPLHTRHLHQLRQLAGNGLGKKSLFNKIRLCLQEALGSMGYSSPNESLQMIVNVTYRSIMIHMLFSHDSLQRQTLEKETLEDFNSEAITLLETISSFISGHPSFNTEAARYFSTTAEIFALGLAVCVRAVQNINAQRSTGSTANEPLFADQYVDLVGILNKIHQISKSEILMQTKRAELIQRELESVNTRYDQTIMHKCLDIDPHFSYQPIVSPEEWDNIMNFSDFHFTAPTLL